VNEFVAALQLSLVPVALEIFKLLSLLQVRVLVDTGESQSVLVVANVSVLFAKSAPKETLPLVIKSSPS